MPTWHYVIEYGQQVWDWLESECYPHPALREGNRLPSTGDLKWALEATENPPVASLIIDDTFDWNDDAFIPKSVRMRGELLAELQLLIKLSERCGPLLLYEAGLPVVTEAAQDALVVSKLNEELAWVEDGERRFFRKMYAPSLDPAWLAWNNATVPRLAEAIYTDRVFDRMPILADALEDAGCHDAEILAHCRGPGPHVQGCWVVDLLLGKT